ncbi:related to IMG2 - mitochondrial ribosomal protein of the large subunit [Ustilago trichophora]|uniref:Large ribosomal subunit protein mL49 n=1 Tax=Ustilago trichophora TaxID=86804 RepID=A0A5C3DSH8_9BASI|nr:related to IMG2 - mitochondrial ribosomal protein of the large subunit [Ustilago trichophora]
MASFCYRTSSLRIALVRQPVASSSKLTLPTMARYNSTTTTTTTLSPQEPEPTTSQPTPTPVRYSYFVPRVGKTLDSLPVYTDIRNGGTRIITELRKIQGSVQDLKTDLSLFLSDTYESNNPISINQDSPLKLNKKPPRPRPGRKLVHKTANPTYFDPVQSGNVLQGAKLKIRGNRVDEVKAFLESRGF